MKAIAIFSIIFVWTLFFVGCTNDLVAPENPALSGDDTEGGEYQSISSSAPVAISAELATLFDKELVAANLTSQKVTLVNYEAVQEAVWQAWKKANAADLAKFPQLKEFPQTHLETAAAPKWTVPGALGGRDYDMPYEYGWLGSQPNKESNQVPVFIYLHGSGEDRDLEWQNGSDACKNSILRMSNYRKGVFFNPRGPDGSDYNKWFKTPYQRVWEDFLKGIFLQDYINPYAIFLSGYSEGAYASQRMASFYADYFTGVAPLAGGEPLENAPPENLLHTRIFMISPNQDHSFGRNELTKKLKETLEAWNASFKTDSTPIPYEYFSSINVDYEGKHGDVPPYEGMGGLTNITRYRTTNPTEVRWEDFPMDGQRRVGFYNIHVLERASTTDERTYYQLKIKSDNAISLSAQKVSYTVTNYCSSDSSIPLDYKKNYTPVTGGKLRIYLHPYMNNLDLTKPITITINEGAPQQLQPVVSVQAMIDSVKAFFDSQRIYPAYIEVDLTPQK